MKAKVSPKEIWQEYEKARAFNNGIDLYETVERNEDFFLGEQWRGLIAPDLDKPVFNFLKRVVNYFVSMIVADDIGISITAEGLTPVLADGTEISPTSVLEQEVEKTIEKSKIASLNRYVLRDAAVTGDGCLYFYYDADTRAAVAELVDNTRILFGNPYIQEVQKQPYIIIVKPVQLDSAKDMAEKEGVDPALIMSDYDVQSEAGGNPDNSGDDRVTLLVKLWKEDGKVWSTTVTANTVIKKPICLEYRRYPVAFMNWERVKNRYHGYAAVSGLIPNQIAVNKLWAMALRHASLSAFPKLIYDSTKIKGWDNSVGEAIGVKGPPTDVVTQVVRGGEMSPQVVEVVERTISMTRDFMGASDAALGNVKPDNTSAIIATQQASSAPLELQKRDFYQFVEDYVRIIIDIICADYGERPINYSDDNISATVKVDFGLFDPESMELQVDVGEGAYWSELTQMHTLDNLFGKGIITDAVTYLESIPAKYLRNKSRIIKQLKERAAQMQSPGLSDPSQEVPNVLPGM